jgi:DNA relaxase NicK
MKNRKIAFDGHTGEWVGKKVDIKSSTTYVLSGGKLKTRKAIVDKLSEFFNVPVSDISGLSIYKELKDSGWVYYASSSTLDDISRINPIERKHNCITSMSLLVTY